MEQLPEFLWLGVIVGVLALIGAWVLFRPRMDAAAPVQAKNPIDIES